MLSINQSETVPNSVETIQNPTENAVSNAETVPNSVVPVENIQETTPPATEPTALQRIPRNEKGEPIFEQAESPEVGWDALVEFSEGDATTAKEIADTMVDEKRKTYEKAQKQKPKGKTPTEILASKKAITAALAQAEQEYNLWQQMANVEKRRQDAIRAEREAEARRLAAEREEAEKAERAAKEEAARLEREEGIADDSQQGTIEPTGGDFGPIFTQFKGDAKGAISKLIELKAGEAIGALHHRDVGDIDLVWGIEGTGHSDGMGLAKLVKYHPEVVEHLQDILDDMVVVKRTEDRINLESETHKAAVRLTWNNEAKKWLLTAFEKRETPKSIDKTTDTGDNPTDMRGDTALSQNSGVSDHKDTNSATEKQESGQESSVQPSDNKDEQTANEPIALYSEENANFASPSDDLNGVRLFSIASRYETSDGKTVRYTSENPEVYGGLFDFDFSNEVPGDGNATEGGQVDRRQQSGPALQRKNTALLANASERLNEANGENIITESRTIPITSRGTTDLNGIVDAKLQQFFERASSEAIELNKVDRVNELSDKLGVPIKIISDREEIDNLPSARHRRSKGWWSDESGVVVVVATCNALHRQRSIPD